MTNNEIRALTRAADLLPEWDADRDVLRALLKKQAIAPVCGQPAQPAASADQAKRWPFVEAPGEFAYRFSKAFDLFDGDIVACVRHTLIENPATIAAPVAAQPSVPEPRAEYLANITDSDETYARCSGYVEGWNDCREAMIKGQK